MSNSHVEFTRNGFFVGQPVNMGGMYLLDLNEDGNDHGGSKHGVFVLDVEFSNGESVSIVIVGVLPVIVAIPIAVM